MLWTIALILIILWLLGLVTSTTMGGLVHVLLDHPLAARAGHVNDHGRPVHVLLVIAVVVILVQVIQGRRVV